MAHVKDQNTARPITEYSSFGVDDSIPEPVAMGDAHDGRNADQVTAEPEATAYAGAAGADQPTHVDVSGTEAPTKSELISGILTGAYSMAQPELAAIYGELCKMGGFGGDTHDGRTADQSTGSDREPETYREDVKLVLAGSELSEDAINRATVLFEAAVNNRMIEVVAKLDEVYDARMNEALDEKEQEMEVTNAKYMDYLSEKWLEENQVAIDSNIRTEMAESFLAGLRELFEDHYIDIPEDKVDVVSAMSEEIADLEDRLSAAEAELIDRNEQVEEEEIRSIRASAVERASAGLTESQKDRLSVLAESVDFETEEDLVDSLKAISDVTVATRIKSGADQLNEEVQIDSNVDYGDADPVVSQIAQFASRKNV